MPPKPQASRINGPGRDPRAIIVQRHDHLVLKALPQLCRFDSEIVEIAHIPLAALECLKRGLKIDGIDNIEVNRLTDGEQDVYPDA